MNSDIKLDADGDGWVTVETNVLRSSSSDFMLDCPPRRKGSNEFRRALVHNENDGLTVNFAGDYPGGVTIDGDLTVADDLVVQDNLTVGRSAAMRPTISPIAPDRSVPL